jgi:hypothetical protein
MSTERAVCCAWLQARPARDMWLPRAGSKLRSIANGISLNFSDPEQDWQNLLRAPASLADNFGENSFVCEEKAFVFTNFRLLQLRLRAVDNLGAPGSCPVGSPLNPALSPRKWRRYFYLFKLRHCVDKRIIDISKTSAFVRFKTRNFCRGTSRCV